MRFPALLLRLAPLCLLGPLFACGKGTSRAPRLLSCERLAFVPAGVVAGGMARSPFDLLVDRFEVSRGLWRAVRKLDRDLPELSGRLGIVWAEEGDDSLPATGMDALEARRCAAARGMRLPSTQEWFYIAAGERAQFYPWGNSLVRTAANTWEVGLGSPAAVGTFPAGVTRGGIYDLVGNVWEWTEPPLIEDAAPYGWSGSGAPPFGRWAMGGSYKYPVRPLFGSGPVPGLLALGLEEGSRSIDVGLRCVAEAEPYLRAHAEEWSSPAYRERVIAVGRRWGPRAAGLLERLAADPEAPAALAWLAEGSRR